MNRFHTATTAVLLATLAVSTSAQSPRAQLLVTVADTTGAVIPGARVTVVGVEQATRSAVVAPAVTSGQGVATLAVPTPGLYTIVAEYPGFELGMLKDVRIRAGDNRHLVVVKIQGLRETVDVAQNPQAAASTRTAPTFGGVKFTQEQLDALSDDRDELERQLRELAGPDAIIRVDTFEGLQLPPKAQIKSIHITRDQFAAESANAGDTFIDIVTQAGIGPLRGTVNTNVRAADLSARNPFAPLRGVDQNQVYGLTIGGALQENKSSFSLNVSHSMQQASAALYVLGPDGHARSETLSLSTPSTSDSLSALFDYSLTRDQTLRLAFYRSNAERKNAGVGGYDYPERAYTSRSNESFVRLQEAGPIGRRMFVNTRLFIGTSGNSNQSLVEQPTIRVQDAFTIGGAQQRGGSRTRELSLASDLDYIRGMHSWRTGIRFDGQFVRSNAESNYLGSYTFPNLDAYVAGAPSVYTRIVGDPLVKYFNGQIGVYVQDDLRVSKGLTVSPGLRYSVQTILPGSGAYEPRFGVTWAPRASGTTTLRASVGMFHGWFEPNYYEQTLRVDGARERELVLVNPAYPDPGTGSFAPVGKYLLGPMHLPRQLTFGGGVDHVFSPHFRVNLLYRHWTTGHLSRGNNLNAPDSVNGVRPDPNFTNVIETVADGTIRRRDLFATATFNLAPAGAGGARLNWRRVSGVMSYSRIYSRRDVGTGRFDVPPTGNLATEWGNGPQDQPYRITLSAQNTQLRNMSVSVTWLVTSGTLYNWTTGLDENQDGILNDRPAGVGLWRLRGAGNSTLSTRIAYTLTPGSPPGTPTARVRYRLVLFANASNLLNHANYGGYSGVATSPFFQQPTTVTNPRRVDFGATVNF